MPKYNVPKTLRRSQKRMRRRKAETGSRLPPVPWETPPEPMTLDPIDVPIQPSEYTLDPLTFTYTQPPPPPPSAAMETPVEPAQPDDPASAQLADLMARIQTWEPQSGSPMPTAPIGTIPWSHFREEFRQQAEPGFGGEVPVGIGVGDITPEDYSTLGRIMDPESLRRLKERAELYQVQQAARRRK